MGVRRAAILFADIIDSAEVSNNCTITEYDDVISQFQKVAKEAEELLFPAAGD